MKNPNPQAPVFISGWASTDKVVSLGWHRAERGLENGRETVRLVPCPPPQWWLDGVPEAVNWPTRSAPDDSPLLDDWAENDDW